MAMANPPLEGNRLRFEQKLVEMLGKGFKDKEHYNFVADINRSRKAYKIHKSEREYFVIRALLNLPVLIKSQTFLMTLKDILEFYRRTLQKLIKNYLPKMGCLRAIEDAHLECYHLRNRETSAFLVHFLHQIEILDELIVLEFNRHLEQRESYLLNQESFRMLISWMQDEAMKKRVEGGGDTYEDWAGDDDDRPLSHWLRRGIEQSMNVQPLVMWSADREAAYRYKPLFIWVSKDGEEVADDSDDDDDEDDPKDDEQDAIYDDDDYYDEEESDFDDIDADEELDDINNIPGGDFSLKYLFRNMTKNYLKKMARQ